MELRRPTRRGPHFDLNQTRYEPTDEQLDELMRVVNGEVLKSAARRRAALQRELRAAIADIFTRYSRSKQG